MANELNYYGTLDQTGLTVVARVYDSAGTQVGSDVSCSEAGSLAIYAGDMPTAPLGQYGVRFFNGTTLLGQGIINWDGTGECELNLDVEVSTREAESDAATRAATNQTEHDATQADIAALNDFDPANDTVARVTLVDTTTTNTDMRGTDGANTQTPLTAAQVNTEVDAALADYDGPTKAELDTAESNIIAAIPAASTPLTAQQVRDAMKLAPSAGAPASDSIDEKIDANEAKIDIIDTIVDAIRAKTDTLVNTDLSSLETKAQADARQAILVQEHNDTQTAIGSQATPLTAQQVRDSMKLAPSAGVSATDSIDDKLDDVESDVSNLPTATQIATAVEAAIINEGDGQQVIDAILQVFNANLDLPALELTAIAQAVRTELATELARLDEAISATKDANIVSVTGSPVTDVDDFKADVSGSLTPQQVRDAMKLAPSAGVSSAESVDDKLDDIETNQGVVNEGVKKSSLLIPHFDDLPS